MLLKKYKIKKYFFLDCSFPMIYSLSKKFEKNIALRFSEFEGIDTICNIKNKIKWIWIDCFTKFPLDENTFKILKNYNLKFCLVSPELQNHPISYIKKYSKEFNNISFDAICTKRIDIWKNILNKHE